MRDVERLAFRAVAVDVDEHQDVYKRQVMRNVGALLADAGTDFDHVAKATCFLVDLGDFAAVNEVYARSFGAHLPARSAVQVAGLPKGALVEVEVMAEVPGA